MKERIVKLAQSIDRLNLRERLFLFAAGLVVVGGLWEAALAAPLGARERIATDKVAALQGRLQQLDTAVNAAASGLSEGMPSQIDRLRALRERVAAGDDEVRVFTTDLVNPAEMRLVLEELLRRQAGLTLVSATNLAARPLVADDEEAQTGATVAAAPSAAPKLYRHTLVLKLEGSYLDCLSYLQAVERLHWHLYWARLELSSDDYPRNQIVLELRTLSLSQEWIGV
jgi:MSHA biogenesis protein MshJ